MNRLWEWYAGDNDSRIARYASNRKGDSEYIEMPNNRPFDYLKSVFIFFAGLAIILAIWRWETWPISCPITPASSLSFFAEIIVPE